MFFYGKIFSSMFRGSLYGKGWGPLLVMNYAVANATPDKEFGMVVDLNPKEMADRFGEDESDVRAAIGLLCEPDPDTTTPDEDGKRLVKLGAFQYRLVNGLKYQAITNEEKRREAARIGMAKIRAVRKPNSPSGYAFGPVPP